MQKRGEPEQEVKKANERLNAVIDSNNHTWLREAYEQLVTAQNSLTDAKQVLINLKDTISQTERSQMADRISDLEEKVRELTEELAKAKAIDITYYEVTMPDAVEYSSQGAAPEVKVAGLRQGRWKNVLRRLEQSQGHKESQIEII